MIHRVFSSIGGGVGSLTLARLLILKEKLKQQRAHLDELDAHMYVSPSAILPRVCGLILL